MSGDQVSGAQAARAALDQLEAARGVLAAGVAEAEQALSEAQRAALNGGGDLAGVVAAQGRQDAARGVLDLHDQDVSRARAELARAELDERASQRHERARAAVQTMNQAAAAHMATLAAAEQALSEALAELDQLSHQHRDAVHVLAAAARDVQGEGGDARAFLAGVGSDWTTWQLAPWWTGALGLPRSSRLARAAGQD